MTTELRTLLEGFGDPEHVEVLQELWGGYGQLLRITLDGAKGKTLIVKQIDFPPPKKNHPRGWQSAFSHQRKLHSYQVEAHWYRQYAASTTADCYCPKLLAIEENGDGLSLILEDLGAQYPVVTDQIALPQVEVCLNWLAQFHAQFLGTEPDGLWSPGTYWHLATRPDEHQSMPDGELKNVAERIDAALQQTPYQTLVHGDAKLANFCFSEDGQHVAAVDFQYVGRGCGMLDVVYFMTSCLSDSQCFEHADALLDDYFKTLLSALAGRRSRRELDELEIEWRRLYPVAWADFQRFLAGWSPNHWKLNDYMAQQTELALSYLKRNQA